MPFTNAICHSIVVLVTTKLFIDKAGRILLPKPLRDELQLSPGDALELDSTGEAITLRPVRGVSPLRKKRGVWVFNNGQPLLNSTVNETVRRVRSERDDSNLTTRKQNR